MATGQLYEVFARRTRDEPLGHVGTVNATSIDFARVYASWDAFRTSAFGYARGNELSYRRDAFPRVG